MSNYKNIDLSYLDELALGSNEFKIEMIESFITTTPESIETMKKSIEEGNWKTIGGLAHKMKTSFSFVGMENMVQLSKKLQDLGLAEEKTNEIPAMVSELASVYAEAEVELKAELQNLQNG